MAEKTGKNVGRRNWGLDVIYERRRKIKIKIMVFLVSAFVNLLIAVGLG